MKKLDLKIIEKKLGQYKDLLQNPLVSVWVFDKDCRIVSINDLVEQNNKLNINELIGKDCNYLDSLKIFDQLVSPQVMKNKKQVTIVQYSFSSKKHFISTGTPIFNEYGNIIFIIVTAYDITQLYTLHEQLNRISMKAEKLEDELKELTFNKIKNQDIIAISDKMNEIISLAFKLSRTGTSGIMLLGESGTGKGMMAKFIHSNSQQSESPFIQINCAALPENLLEAELFGYEKGAFTGATDKGKIGLLELAQGGTLFLDEIGELPLSFQAKLLKYLDDHEFIPLGGTKTKKVDCRIVAATNRNLQYLVKKRQFRQDLFYRLNIFTIKMPPLREIPEDLFGLVKHYINKYNVEFETNCRIGQPGFDILQSHQFPGNVRELKNIIQKAIVLSEKDILDDFIIKNFDRSVILPTKPSFNNKASGNFKTKMAEVEKSILENAIANCQTTRELSSYLEISQSTVVRMMKKHQLHF